MLFFVLYMHSNHFIIKGSTESSVGMTLVYEAKGHGLETPAVQAFLYQIFLPPILVLLG